MVMHAAGGSSAPRHGVGNRPPDAQWVVAAPMVVAVVVGALSPILGTRFLLVPVIGLPLGAIWWLARRKVDDESPRNPLHWLAIAACTVVAVAAFVVLMGWVGGEL